MDRLEFNCVFDLADTLQAMLGDVDDDYPLISVYGKYDVIKPLLEDLIMSGVKIANEIELEDYDVSHYDKDFVLYLSTYGVNVEKAYRDGSYLYGAGNISFVHEDCNSKLLPYVQSDVIYEFGITDEDDECDQECDCEECQCACKEETKPTTTAKESYNINGKPCTKDEFLKVEEEFNKVFRDSLLSWCEVMDSMNEMRKLLHL